MYQDRSSQETQPIRQWETEEEDVGNRVDSKVFEILNCVIIAM